VPGARYRRIGIEFGLGCSPLLAALAAERRVDP
jgi:hypothetical protein